MANSADLDRKGLADIPVNRIIIGAVIFLLIIIATGGVFYHFVEHWTWLDSVYFSVVTLATVGYGDLTPKTDAGKIFTMFFIFFGIGIFVAVANLVIRNTARRRGAAIKERHERRHPEEANK